MIIDLPIIEVWTPNFQHQLYIESMNLLIGITTTRYFAFEINGNEIKINEEISYLIQNQQKIMTLPNKERVLGQNYFQFTVFDLQKCNIISQHTIQSHYQLHAINTDISSQKLFLICKPTCYKVIYSFNNWKKKLLFQDKLNYGLFGKYTYCLYSIKRKYIYRSKINKKIRSFEIQSFTFNFNDKFMVYENQDFDRKEGVNIKDNIKLAVNFFSMQRKLIVSLIINKFFLITSGNQLIIIDKNTNQVIKQNAIIKKNDLELCNYLGYQTDKCIYVFITTLICKI